MYKPLITKRLYYLKTFVVRINERLKIARRFFAKLEEEPRSE